MFNYHYHDDFPKARKALNISSLLLIALTQLTIIGDSIKFLVLEIGITLDQIIIVSSWFVFYYFLVFVFRADLDFQGRLLSLAHLKKKELKLLNGDLNKVKDLLHENPNLSLSSEAKSRISQVVYPEDLIRRFDALLESLNSGANKAEWWLNLTLNYVQPTLLAFVALYLGNFS